MSDIPFSAQPEPFVQQPALLLDGGASLSRISIETYIPSPSVDMRIQFTTVFPTALDVRLSLTLPQAVELAERIMAAVGVIGVPASDQIVEAEEVTP